MARQVAVTILVPATPAALSAAAEGLAAVNYALIRAGGEFPSLYSSGVVYRPEPIGTEDWLTIPEVLSRGEGDCEDLSAWRAAELRSAGEPAIVEIRHNAGGSYHAIVRRVDGSIEDPSRILIELERASGN